jgi:thioredoxin 1
VELWLRLLVGAVIGVAAGATVGLLARRSTERRGNPVVATPLRGALLGLAIGLVATFLIAPEPITERAPSTVVDADAIEQLRDRAAFNRHVLGARKPVLVDFYIPNCLPCEQVAPTIVQLSEIYRGRAGFFRVNGEELPELARAYGVGGYPTIIVFEGGRPMEALPAPRALDVYARVLDRAIEKAESRTRTTTTWTSRPAQ